jgi:hypothetical protein
MDDSDDIPDFELFDISDVKVHYERSKDQKKGHGHRQIKHAHFRDEALFDFRQ